MASINSLQDMGWPVSARTLAAASSALSFLLCVPASLVFLDLAFLGLFDVAMTRLPFSWGLPISGSADIALPTRAGSVLGFALKSRQLRLRVRRFRQVLSWPRNLPDSPKLALR